jgi:hypothetical protein
MIINPLMRRGMSAFTKVMGDKKSMAALIGLTVLLIIIIGISAFAPVNRYADGSTYYMQIQSIANDLDVEYQPVDIQRVMEHRLDDVPDGMNMIKTPDGRYYYGKDYSYALFASPWFKLFSNNGILIFNGLMFFGMILWGYLHLRKKNDDISAAAIAALFFFFSIAFIYVFWVHTEVYNMFLIMLGTFLWLHYRENKDVRWLFVAGFVFGLATVAGRKTKNLAAMATAFAVPIVLFYGYFFLVSGSLSTYGGDRLYYYVNYPFTNGFNVTNEAGVRLFSLSTNTDLVFNTNNVAIIPYNIFYYFVGKFTGLLWYYPLGIFAVLAFVLSLKNPKSAIMNSPEKFAILAGVVCFIALYVTLIGNNYPGGADMIGDRYFYVYPALLFLLDRVDLRKFAFCLMIPIVTLSPMIADPVGNSVAPEKHVFNFPYQYLPIEYSQLKNLPIYSNYFNDGDYKFFSLNGAHSNDTLNNAIVGHDAAFFLRANKKIDTLRLAVIPVSDNTTGEIDVMSRASAFDLDADRVKTIVFNDPVADYYDGRYYIYSGYLHTNAGVLMTFEADDGEGLDGVRYIKNWYGEENWSGTKARWMSNNASMIVYSGGVNHSGISFDISNFHNPRTLIISVNGEPDVERTIDRWTTINIDRPLAEGYNLITISSLEAAGKPSDVPEMNNKDSRDLSFVIKNLNVTRVI